MDPVTAFGVAAAVVGLVPLCADGFEMIVKCIDAPKDARETFALVQVQAGKFVAWAEEWKIGQEQSNSTAQRRSLLQEHLSSGTKTGGYILIALVSIANAFSGVQELETTYGIKMKPNQQSIPGDLSKLNVADILNGKCALKLDSDDMRERKKRMNLLKRARFVFRGSSGLEKLALDLEKHIGALLDTCPGRIAWRIEMVTSLRLIRERDKPEQLQTLVTMAENQSSRRAEKNQDHSISDLLRSTANFKVRLQSIDPDRFHIYHEEEIFRYNVPGWKFSDGDGTMAISTRSRRVRYVEWKSYSKDNGEDGLENERDIKKFALLLASDAKPAEICTRRCLGVFKDPFKTRYGFLYEPPPYIENFWSTDSQDRDVAEYCKPVSLLRLLEPARTTSILDLGIRFYLAKRLAKSVLILHAAGWVHKNIRSTAVMFLPAQSQVGGPSRYGRIEYNKPWLCGFGRSRPENISDSNRGYAPVSQKPMPGNDDDDDRHGVTTTGIYYPRQIAEVRSDIYQHPDKRKDPLRQHIPAYDVYSLGCVLLELGLWQSLDTFHKGSYSADKFRDVLKSTTQELIGQTGSKYASATKACLNITSGINERQTQDLLFRSVLAVLEDCSA
ncbi:hypothetical protein BGZ57DRAFT_977186 [Hyaloscypha finlandica]|nr:hypothetical protein BGZ57DRAFT_977186 [Hyaloscypha finlandica]